MKARIVTDTYSGYEVQIWHWWWPFWLQYGFTNTYQTVDEAEKVAIKILNSRKVVKVVKVSHERR